MKLWIGCFITLLMSCDAAAVNRAVIVVDSDDSSQSALVSDINQMLFYSPTLRSHLVVEVFDINPHGTSFSGTLTYKQDSGQAAARYRPEKLPFLICFEDEKELLRMEPEDKEQLCLCTQIC